MRPTQAVVLAGFVLAAGCVPPSARVFVTPLIVEGELTGIVVDYFEADAAALALRAPEAIEIELTAIGLPLLIASTPGDRSACVPLPPSWRLTLPVVGPAAAGASIRVVARRGGGDSPCTGEPLDDAAWFAGPGEPDAVADAASTAPDDSGPSTDAGPGTSRGSR